MTDNHQPEVFESGVAVLAESEPSWDDGPFPVRGVALPEGITTNGNSEGETVYWPPEIVETAAEHFEDAKITDPSQADVYEHDPETAIERPQPSPQTIIGEVTEYRYEPGVGVLYQGEVDDPEIAKRIHRNRVEVSPTIFRTLGDRDEDRDARIPDSIVGVRDLSVVAKGQAEGNSIEPATVAMSALSASALEAAFDGAGAEVLQLTTEQTDLVQDALGDFVESQGNASLQTLQDWAFENEELGTDTKVALEAALDEVFSSFDPVPGEFRMDLFREWLATAETLEALTTDTTMGAESPADADGTSDDGQRGQSTADRTREPMSEKDTLTDDQRELLAAAEALDEPTVISGHGIVESEHAEVLEAAAGCEEPHVDEQDEWNAHQSRVETLEAIMNERLTEDKGLKEATVEAMSFEAKAAEFEDEEGEFDAETLVQIPETGQPEGDGGDDEAVAEVLEAEGFEDRDEAVEILEGRYEQYEKAGWESPAEQAKKQLDALGVEVS